MKIDKNNETNEKFIEMTELSKMIKTTNWKTAVKWCEDANIPIIPIGKKKITFRFLVETELDKKVVKLLKKQHPQNWEDLYRCYQNNDRYGYIIACETENEIKNEDLKEKEKRMRTKPKSQFAQEFANE